MMEAAWAVYSMNFCTESDPQFRVALCLFAERLGRGANRFFGETDQSGRGAAFIDCLEKPLP